MCAYAYITNNNNIADSRETIIAAVKDNGCASHYPFSERKYSTEVLTNCPNLTPNQKGKNHE